MIVIVGHQDHSFAKSVLEEYPTAQLCNELNIDSVNNIVYTSVHDLSLNNLITLLDRATEIVYKPKNLTRDERESVEPWLLYYARSKKVTGEFLNNSDFLRLADYRKTDSSQLWISGCSISDGVGVEQSSRWGQVLADHLSMPVSFLTEAGTSIEWAADQIIRSDIRKDDLVVWGVTSTSRYMHYSDNGTRYNIMPNQLFGKSKVSLIEKNLGFKAVHHIYQVINFLNKIGCKFRFMLMFPPMPDHYFVLHKLLAEKNIILGFDQNFNFVDIGTDGIHPGPMQHKKYAEKVLSSL